MPAEAYDQLVAGLTKDALKRQGIDRDLAREPQDRHSAGIPDRRRHDRAGIKGRKWVMAVKDSDMTALSSRRCDGGADGYSERRCAMP